MPQRGLLASPDLAIELDNGPVFNPGDTILGRVVRLSPMVDSGVQITLTLHGRCKSKLDNDSNNLTGKAEFDSDGGDVLRGRFDLFSPEKTEQLLHRGPLHIAVGEGPASWAFEVAIPAKADPWAVRMHDPKFGFVSMKPKDIESMPLPPRFEHFSINYKKTLHGYVDYYLSASLASGKQSAAARLPLFLEPPGARTAIGGVLLKRTSLKDKVWTQRLVPGRQDDEPSLKQKMQKLVHSSKVPTFEFTLQVDCPSVIQLGNDTPVPFRLRVVPGASSTVIRGAPQRVTLTALSLSIVAETVVMCPGIVSECGRGEETHSLEMLSVFQRLQSELALLVIPCGADEDPLDLGEYLELRVTESNASVRGYLIAGRFTGRLYPSFVTYNIKHTHRLKWKATIEIAGEARSFSGEQPFELLRPSMAPPPQYEDGAV